MEDFLGPQSEYNEEEEERKYYRRKRLGVIKNVVGASVGAMIVYSVYMGETDQRKRTETFTHTQKDSTQHGVTVFYRPSADAADPPL